MTCVHNNTEICIHTHNLKEIKFLREQRESEVFWQVVQTSGAEKGVQSWVSLILRGLGFFGGSKPPLPGDPLISSIGPRYQCVPLVQGLCCLFLSKWIPAGRVSSTEMTAGCLFWGLTWEDPVVIARKNKLNRTEKGI